MIRVHAVELLRLLKKEYTYEELSKMFQMPAPALSRYIQGHVLPRTERAKDIIRKAMEQIDLSSEIIKRLRWTSDGFFDNTRIVSDTVLLKLIAEKVARNMMEKKPTKVLTAAVDGIPLATIIAAKMNIDLVYAKKTKEIGIDGFLEETVKVGNSGFLMTLYLPRHALSARDRVLIVDDIIRTGETQKALIRLCKKARAKIVGIFILIAVGDEWRKTLEGEGLEVKYFVKISPPKIR